MRDGGRKNVFRLRLPSNANASPEAARMLLLNAVSAGRLEMRVSYALLSGTVAACPWCHRSVAINRSTRRGTHAVVTRTGRRTVFRCRRAFNALLLFAGSPRVRYAKDVGGARSALFRPKCRHLRHLVSFHVLHARRIMRGATNQPGAGHGGGVSLFVEAMLSGGRRGQRTEAAR